MIKMAGGDSADKPFLVGKDDGSPAVFVEATGLYEGIPKGRQLWVTGDRVGIGLARGNIIALGSDSLPVVKKVTRISTKEPPSVMESEPWHETEPVPEPEPEPEPDVVEAPGEQYNPANHTVKQVIAYIEEHPDEAGAILAAERAGQNRKSIIREFS